MTTNKIIGQIDLIIVFVEITTDQNIKIIAVEDSEELNVLMEYKSVSINEEVRFPFKIPSGFEEIILEDAK